MKRMRTASLMMALLALQVAPLSAGDPWKEKPPAEWTDKDFQKFFTKSPWAKLYSRSAPTSSSDNVTAVAQDSGGRGGGASTGGQTGPRVDSFQIVVSWGSSRIFRMAQMAAQIQQGAEIPEDEQQKRLADTDFFAIHLGGKSASGYIGMAEEEAKTLTQLKFKNSKKILQPDHFVAPQKRGQLAVFVFNGKQELMADVNDKEQFEFQSKVSGQKVKVTFKAKDMKLDGKFDL